MGTIGSTAEKALSSAVKAATAATAAATTAVAALAKTALDGFAEYEQLTGGVETLFKTSAETVNRYAANAYKTAGMSANTYMSTVTSFSASLLQGLGGNTAAAAEIANQAIVDMSDNANKMGTDMSLIQNAYQGFAKQNYTMLDNLKLGYGGTQSEMARLINDSGVLGNSMTVTAETVNSVSFDKIIEAIHVVQTNMGITGTTAKEAASTIQGSIAAMQGAYTNFMVGMADPTQDFDVLTSNLIDSVLTVADNLLPRIQALLPQLARGFTDLADGILPLIPETLESLLPDVLEGANAIVESLLNVIAESADTAAPVINKAAPEIIGTFVNGIDNALPAVVSAAIDIIAGLTTALLDNAGEVTQAAVDILTALADGVSDNLPELVPAAVEAALTIVGALFDNCDKVIAAGISLIKALAEGIINAVPVLLEKAPSIIIELVDTLSDTSTEKIIAVPLAICQGIADGLMNFDWSAAADTASYNLAEAWNKAQGYDTLGSQEEAEKRLAEAQQQLRDKINSETSLTGSMSAEAAKRAEEEAKKHFGVYGSAVADSSDKISDAISQSTEDIEKTQREAEARLKKSTEDKLRALEIRQLEEGLSDEWLYDEWEKIIADLDRNSDLYLDNYQKILEGRSRINEQKLKEQEETDKAERDAAKKQRNALKKTYESILSERDSLASKMALSGDIFESTEITDKRSGEKTASRKINIEEFERKIAAKKQLTSKIAELLDKNTPDEIISQLLNSDPEDALYYANELLKSPSKLSRLAAGFAKDDAYSNILANMVTEHSEDFSALGTDAGHIFGESFIEAFHSDWENAFSSVFSEENTADVSAAVSYANSSAASESTYVRRDYPSDTSDSTNSVRRTSASSGTSGTYKILDLNGTYIATVVNTVNNRRAITGGG